MKRTVWSEEKKGNTDSPPSLEVHEMKTDVDIQLTGLTIPDKAEDESEEERESIKTHIETEMESEIIEAIRDLEEAIPGVEATGEIKATIRRNR